MNFELTKEYIAQLQKAIEEQDTGFIKTEMEELYPSDISEILYELDTDEAHYLINQLETDLAAEIISNLDPTDRKRFLKVFTSAELAEYINVADSDDAVDILNEQNIEVREEVIALLKDREQARFILDMLNYPNDVAGGLMQKELVKIKVSQTVTECVEEIRRQAEDVEKVYAVYVTDDEGILLGIVSLKKIILAKRGSKIADIFESDIVSVKTTTIGEEVADLMQRYDLEALPVVNVQGRLLGRITIDDVLDFVTEQAQEDLQVVAGLAGDVEETDSVLTLVKARLPWLLVGMVGSFMAAKIIDRFDDSVAAIPAIAAFIPLIGSTGGNVGIQSSSLVVQSLADKSGLDTSLPERLRKSLWVAFLNALVAGIFAFGGSLLVDGANVPLSFVVAMSVMSIVMLASLMGTLTPLVLNYFGINPAIASGPFITTTNDLLGYGVYFLIVYLLL
jgi:magnesium transporter